jgi:molybdate transport system permease protein
VFRLERLLLASVLAKLLFTIQPIQHGFEAIPLDVREAAVSGFSPWGVLWDIDLPLA